MLYVIDLKVYQFPYIKTLYVRTPILNINTVLIYVLYSIVYSLHFTQRC